VKTPILGQAYQATSKILADNRMVNLFPEQAPSDGKEPAMLTRAPGLVTYAGPISDTGVRGLYVSSTGRCYVVIDNYVLSVQGGLFFFLIGGGNLLTTTGPVAMIDNGTQLLIVDGTYGYIVEFSTDTLTQITDPDFPNGATIALYMDTYFIVNKPNTFTFQWSGQNDGNDWDPLDFASAEGSPDYITAGVVVNREIWWFGPYSKEVFYSSGTSAVFERVAGGFTSQGCIAHKAITLADNTCYWLGSDNNGSSMIFRGRGYSSMRVSTHAIEWQMRTYADLQECVAWSYQQDGHTFVVFQFATAEQTWVYDVSSGAWHERAGFDSTTGELNHWRATYHAFFEGKNLVGNNMRGQVMEISTVTYTDLGDPQKFIRSWRQPNNEKKLQMFSKLEIDCEMGVGLVSGQGSDPQLMLRYSNDGGNTWSPYRTAPIGKIGEYGNLSRFWDCGMARDRIWEISMTDPVPFAIVGAYLMGRSADGP
jgi:hypothetical protein